MNGNAQRPKRIGRPIRGSAKKRETGATKKPAGLIATFIVALAGVVIGASGAMISGFGQAARAERSYAAALDLRDAPEFGVSIGRGDFAERRAKAVKRIMSAGAPERLAYSDFPGRAKHGAALPKIIIIFDDMGLDRLAFESVVDLPGPLTFSFLPYADQPQLLADRIRERGDAVMLHLPMEPSGSADPGPHSLTVDMSDRELLRELDWNFNRFTGFIGVNNHMGSKFTRNEEKMKMVLGALRGEGLFFIDSLTTGESKIQKAGEAVGVPVFVRDVFLDPAAGKETVRRQLALVERIAQETGYAVAICHPRPDTIEVLGPWLTSAPARGFQLVTVASLLEIAHAQELRDLPGTGGS